MVVAALTLGACGGDDTSSGSLSAATPAAAPEATSSPVPAPAPTPSPSAAAAVEPYQLGSLSYTLVEGAPADKAQAIRAAMDFAVAHTNTLAAFSGNIRVVYGSGTPTADASYRGQIRFGGSIGRRVALHEMEHWLGVGSTGEWSRMVSGGRFTGRLATARIKALDGPNAVVNADRIHFWPYGLNFDNEFSNTQRHTQIVSAMVSDAGLHSDATAAIAGTRRFQNRSSEWVLQGAPTGSAPVESANATGANQQWQVTFEDGFITLANAQDGLFLEATATGDDAPAAMAAQSNAASQQWEMIPNGDGGWFLLRNRSTRNCLDNIGNLADGAPVRLWGCGGHPNQQWRLVR